MFTIINSADCCFFFYKWWYLLVIYPKLLKICKAFSITVNAQDLIKEQLCLKFFVITCRFCDSCVIYMFTCHMSISQYCWLMLIQHFDTIFEMVCDIYCEYFTPWGIFSLFFFTLKAKHQYYMYVCDCILYFFFVLTFKRIIYIKLTTPPLLAVYFFLAAKVYQLLIILLF